MSNMIFEKSSGLTNKELSYCPGCTHGIVHKLVAEVLVELGVLDNTISVASVGCSVFCNEFFNCDGISSAHGRAPAVATGLKRIHPEKVIFTYQGDGDLASIGAAEIVHAAHRSENITVIFVNNAIYGMTGGQMAPTTLEGQVTTTSPYGRSVSEAGLPLKISEMLATIPGARYIERVSADGPANVRKAKKAIKKAFENQLAGKGFSLVEVLGTCNIGWGMSAVDSMDWLREHMIAYYPLGVYKDEEAL
ncbi:MAG: thiamine pyrophosphate-dependent enzyme [Bacilli bacterium]